MSKKDDFEKKDGIFEGREIKIDKVNINKEAFTNAEACREFIDTSGASTWDKTIAADLAQFFDDRSGNIRADQFNPDFLPLFNSLICRIGTSKIAEMSMRNPLAKLKTEPPMDFGLYMQEYATDTIVAEQYSEQENKKFDARQYIFAPPRVDAAYYEVNRMARYKTSIADATIQFAFTNERGIASLTGEIIKQISNSNKRDEFLYAKRLFTNTLLNKDKKQKKLQPSQIIEIPDLTDRNLSEKDIQDGILDIGLTVAKMPYPSRGFTASGFENACEISELECVASSRLKVINNIKNLAMIYNPEMQEFLKNPTAEIDFFGNSGYTPHKDDLASGLIYCAFATGGISYHQVLEKMEPARVPDYLYQTFWYHNWQMFMASPFKSMIFFVKKGYRDPILKELCYNPSDFPQDI